METLEVMARPIGVDVVELNGIVGDVFRTALANPPAAASPDPYDLAVWSAAMEARRALAFRRGEVPAAGPNELEDVARFRAELERLARMNAALLVELDSARRVLRGVGALAETMGAGDKAQAIAVFSRAFAGEPPPAPAPAAAPEAESACGVCEAPILGDATAVDVEVGDLCPSCATEAEPAGWQDQVCGSCVAFGACPTGDDAGREACAKYSPRPAEARP